MYKYLAYILLLTSVSNVHAQRTTDTFKLYFDLNVPTLNQKMQKKIDLLIYNDKIIPGSEVTIVGYADFLGSEGYNKNLSMKRAEHVKQYLVLNGINDKDITLCMGKGKVDRKGLSDKDGYPTDRRVDIVMNNKTYKEKITSKTRTGKKDTVRKVELTSIKDMKDLKTGTLFQLKNVYFPKDRHIMKPESHAALEELFTVLSENPDIKISIEGHVCCIRNAPDADDMDTFEPHLSVNRAKAIYKYLIDRGIDESRLTFIGYGRSRPIVAIEQTEADAEKNRRVEIRILNK
jgi:outer membrane protein OmpA-like peptidoglycan-associated protein